MQKICKQCSGSYELLDSDIDLYKKVSPVFDGKKYEFPSPEICPDCRFISKGIFRNEHNYYRTKSSMSGKSLISVYAPDRPYKVYSYDEWWGEKEMVFEFV